MVAALVVCDDGEFVWVVGCAVVGAEGDFEAVAFKCISAFFDGGVFDATY